jgi:hypothetical protein
MKGVLFGVIMFFSFQNVFTQTDQAMNGTDETYMLSIRKGIMGIEYTVPDIGYKGDRYYNNWTYGEIFLTSGERITGLYLRYEQYLDQLLWLKEDFRVGVICKACIKGFNLNNDSDNTVTSFIKKRIKLQLESDSTDCLLQLLVNGEYSFYALRKVSRLPDAPKLADDTEYYIFNNDQYNRIKLYKYDLLGVSFIDKTRMKSIIKTNRITLRNNEKEFIRAISLYNN